MIFFVKKNQITKLKSRVIKCTGYLWLKNNHDNWILYAPNFKASEMEISLSIHDSTEHLVLKVKTNRIWRAANGELVDNWNTVYVLLPINLITNRSIPDAADSQNPPLMKSMQNSPTIILLDSSQHLENFQASCMNYW